MELYRFRSWDKLLGDDYKEQEEQYFYFAPPSDQNDPMEGKIDFYWQGDKIRKAFAGTISFNQQSSLSLQAYFIAFFSHPPEYHRSTENLQKVLLIHHN